MTGDVVRKYSWRGRNLRVEVLFSRAGLAQHIWVDNGHGSILVDAGDGCLRDLIEQDLPVEKLRGLFFTHGHFDHMGGLHSLLGFFRMVGRTEPLPVYAPESCTEVFAAVQNFKRCYPDTIPFDIIIHENKANEILTAGDMNIVAIPVIHAGSTDSAPIQAPIPAMGYRVRCDSESVAITGDTGLADSLADLVTGADLAIIEATYPGDEVPAAAMLDRVHLSEVAARKIGALAKQYILVHSSRR